MKKSIYYLILPAFIIMLGCDSKKKEYYQSGNLKSEFSFSDGILDGQYKIFYESGKLKETGHFLKGRKVDTVFRFYDSGLLDELNIFERSNYLKIVKYDIFGKIYSEGKIKNNDSLGWWYYYYPNGNIKFKKEFWKVKNTKLINQYIHYDLEGNIDIQKSNYIKISKNGDEILYMSPYRNLKLQKDRYLWAMIIDTIGKQIVDDVILDTLYPYNDNSFKVINNKFYKGFIKEQVFIDTIINKKRMTIIREQNTFFIKKRHF